MVTQMCSFAVTQLKTEIFFTVVRETQETWLLTNWSALPVLVRL